MCGMLEIEDYRCRGDGVLGCVTLEMDDYGCVTLEMGVEAMEHSSV